MSKRARARSKTMQTDDQSICVQGWMPDYEHACEICGTRPVVTGLRDGHVVIATGMCGACTCGDYDAVGPSQS